MWNDAADGSSAIKLYRVCEEVDWEPCHVKEHTLKVNNLDLGGDID